MCWFNFSNALTAKAGLRIRRQDLRASKGVPVTPFTWCTLAGCWRKGLKLGIERGTPVWYKISTKARQNILPETDVFLCCCCWFCFFVWKSELQSERERDFSSMVSLPTWSQRLVLSQAPSARSQTGIHTGCWDYWCWFSCAIVPACPSENPIKRGILVTFEQLPYNTIGLWSLRILHWLKA